MSSVCSSVIFFIAIFKVFQVFQRYSMIVNVALWKWNFLRPPMLVQVLKFVSTYCIGEVHNDKSSPFCLWLFTLPVIKKCTWKSKSKCQTRVVILKIWHGIGLNSRKYWARGPEYISENGQEYDFLIFVKFCDRWTKQNAQFYFPAQQFK